ncbi:DUF2461 domain-containing protein [Chryseolinea lacunae]|uniref:DUF2461 domain-containing protein n=1 Tax=Chryseolinea lacunae TaxID=2801331 RepID=A0ABS1KQ29_9BACT|nr:DUF2461 domain-containing protein [Chryseolinea lacunae]MBL0741564.1 DUF2461 domain-containing protein [Chryseolinea lacunae]
MAFEATLKFLKDIRKNNNREWFEKKKPHYLELKADFDVFVAELLNAIIPYDASLQGLDPKKLSFRIYRDVRFSKDKTPYKTNMSVALSSTGKGMGTPGYYFQLEPGNKSFVAVGLFQPIPENLAKIRQEIDYTGETLGKIVNDKKFKSVFGKFWDEDALKTVPKGYAKDHPHIEWLKLKSFIVTHEFTDSEVLDKKFLKKLVDTMRAAKPLNDYLKEAIS